MTADTIAAIISAVAATIGLFYTAYQIRSDNQTKQLTLLQSVYSDIKDLEQRFYDKYEDQNEEEKHTWDYQFFNHLEWFAFLVNNKKIKDKKLTDYFKPAIIQWYEEMFVKHFPKEVIDDKKQFEEFKKLYHKFKES